MLHHFPDMKRLISGADPKDSVRLPCGVLELYSASVADALLDAGYLNVALHDPSGQIKGYRVADFQNSPVQVKSQESLKMPNASCIMYIWTEGDILCAQHWEGFVSRFEAGSMDFIGQSFTK